MFPSRLTLLSQEKRKYLQKILYIQFVKSSLESAVFILSISAITLLGAQSVLQNYFNKLASNLAFSNNKQAEKNLQIKKANKIIDQTESLQSIYTHWTPLLTELGNSIPEKVLLNSISINKTEEKLILSGKAETRAALLELQSNLENLAQIDRAEVPLSQLTSQIDISFSLKIDLAK